MHRRSAWPLSRGEAPTMRRVAPRGVASEPASVTAAPAAPAAVAAAAAVAATARARRRGSSDPGRRRHVPGELLAAEVVLEPVAPAITGRVVLGERVERCAVQRDLRLAVRPHDGGQLRRERRGPGGLAVGDQQGLPERRAGAGGAQRLAIGLLLARIERVAL